MNMASRSLTSIIYGFIFTVVAVTNALGCDIKVSGPISKLARIEIATFIKNAPSNSVICFESNGGSLSEGVEILKALRATPKSFQTKVQRGTACLSACAIAFMGGKRETQTGLFHPWRILEEGGQLGFHMPYFLLEQAIDAKAAERLFAILVSVYDDIANLEDLVPDSHFFSDANTVFGFDQGYRFLYRPFYHTFPTALLDRMNATNGVSEFYYVTDQEQAMRYGIRITDPSKPNRLKTIRDIWNLVKLHEAAHNRNTVRLGHQVLYGQEAYIGLVVHERKYKGQRFYDVTLTNRELVGKRTNLDSVPIFSSEPSHRNSGDHWYVFPEPERNRVLVFESISSEGDLQHGVEQWSDYISSPFNRIYLY